MTYSARCGRLFFTTTEHEEYFRDSSNQQQAVSLPPAPPSRFITFPLITIALIIITAVASILADHFARDGVPFGANWGMKTLNGQWWRLVTFNFAHRDVSHFFWNMLLLLVFGKRLERVLGHWIFLFFYLSCGIAGGIVSLAVNPEAAGYGASAGVMGLAGGLVGVYGLKMRTLSKRQWWKLTVLILFPAGTIYSGFSSPEVDNPGHIGGLVLGLILAIALTSKLGQTTERRRWINVVAALLLIFGAISVRQRNLYVVHLAYAAAALDRGQTDDASRQLHIVLRMRPQSHMMHYLVRELHHRRGDDGCSRIRKRSFHFSIDENLCTGKKCDQQVHTTDGPDGTKVSYEGTIETHNTGSQIMITTTLTTQALGEFGEIGCTLVQTAVISQKLSVKGHKKDQPLEVSFDQKNLLETDPMAIYMRDQALRPKP